MRWQKKDARTDSEHRPALEPLEPRLLLDGQVCDAPLLALGDPVPNSYLIEFSLDIGSDTELSDPNFDGDEGFDPGDVYQWQSAAVTPPWVPGGRDGFKDDAMIFGHDPNPNPPDMGAPPNTRVPVGQGGPAQYPYYFDLDGHDQIDVYLQEYIPPQGHVPEPIPWFYSNCIFDAKHLMISYEDDGAPGWPAGDVPVTRPSPTGVIRGTTVAADEIIGVTLTAGPPYSVAYTYPIADEATIHQSLAPNPDTGDPEDNDVDSLDIVTDPWTCTHWLFTADHEATNMLDPGDIYEQSPAGGAPQVRIDDVIHLGLNDETDIDAFELVWLNDAAGNQSLAIIFSVDDNDPLTLADESGGLNPRMLYASFFTGVSFPLLDNPLLDDVDGLTNWYEPLAEKLDYGDAPDPTFPTLLASNGARHAVVPGFHLGATVDVEADGQPDPAAMGDDWYDGSDDEDGVVFLSPLFAGQTAPVHVVASAAGGLLQGWVDFYANGDWTDPAEQVFVDVPLAAGLNVLSIPVPADAVPGPAIARFRFSTVAGLGFDGNAPDGEVEDHEVEIAESDLKWAQYPAPAYVDNAYYGWNEWSVHDSWQIAADDWYCDTDDPVVDIIWWGSFEGWKEPTAEGVLPEFFHIAIWTDVPATADQPWSHPGYVIWEVDCYNFTWDWVGWDYDPRMTGPAASGGPYEACFRFQQDLDPSEWFYQDPEMDQIYWISIAAAYVEGSPVEFAFGWKTRPRDPESLAPDDAVIIYDPTGAHVGEGFVDGYPIWFPTEEQSWDMAFELSTYAEPEDKWVQEPDLELTGMDVIAGPYGFQKTEYEKFLADDFKCTASGAITTIEIWGSYLNDVRIGEPALFNLAIYADIPADQSPTGYSMPGELLWSSYRYADTEEDWYSGFEFFYDPNTNSTLGEEQQLYLYTFNISSAEAFYQTEGEIYWLGVHHSYDLDDDGDVDGDDLNALHSSGWAYGWKSSADQWNDDGVWTEVNSYGGSGEITPPDGPWSELYNPMTGESMDLAFRLFNDDGTIKWEQYPDTTFYGVSVLDGPVANDYMGYYEKFLADDFLCMESGEITEITIWSSYLFDYILAEDPMFSLAIYKDVPADLSPTGYSMPGALVWDAYLGASLSRVYAWDVYERFYDPNADEIVGYDTVVWQYTFIINPEDAFYQTEGEVYWLGVHHSFDLNADGLVNLSDISRLLETAPSAHGWKTSLDHWNDDAVWVDVDTYGLDPHVAPQTEAWRELRYPRGHYFEGESIDLAFTVSNEPHAKWLQVPDLEDTGIDVNASDQPDDPPMYVLADDFKCTEFGPIREIKIWGSWLHDVLPDGDPANATFTLSLHADIPADQSPTGYSMPGDLLWMRDFQPGSYQVDLYADGLHEGWMDPPYYYDPMGDTQCWRYMFPLWPGELVQQGTPENPVIYWLDVQAKPQGDPGGTEIPLFGWKTSVDHWNDDAVWIRGQEPIGPDQTWGELRYPSGHEWAGDSIDLAFEILSEPLEHGIKWSQPPVPYYPPDAFHGWDELSWYQGPQIVADDWFCESPDPVTDIHWWASFLNWQEPYPPELPEYFHIAIWTDVPAGVAGDWSHPGEVIWETYCDEYTYEFAGWDWSPRWWEEPHPEATFYFTQELPTEEWFWQEEGGNIYWVSISAVYPAGTQPEFPWGWKTRPRDPDSPAPDDAVVILDPTAPTLGSVFAAGMPIEWPQGESWDMAFLLTTQTPELDFGDAPDPTYPTLLASDGARHVIGGPWLGDRTDAPDADPDGQQEPSALGDDNDGNDDEDGVYIPPLVPGQQAFLTVDVNGAPFPFGAALDGWVDWDGNGSWDAGEQVFPSVVVLNGQYILPISVPASAVPGASFARFRISTAGGLGTTGLASDGEVEDHKVIIEELPDNTKWVQLPDLTRNGIDIRVDAGRMLADDFLCTFPSLLTDAHLWGSWKHDLKGEITNLHLSVHSDDPVGPGGTDPRNTFSMPDLLLWQADFGVGEFQEVLYAELPQWGEYFWDPVTGELLPSGDRQVWRIDIDIDPDEAFIQRGDEGQPVIYWLDVRAQTKGGEFGWKTRQWAEHFMDDAVWQFGVPPTWQELRYPPGHPYHGLEDDSIDMAFVLTWAEAPPEDFGDAPRPYPTLAAANGARHVVIAGGPWLGDPTDGPDAEPNGQPDPAALGDDNDVLYPPANDDEDGVGVSTLVAGQPATVTVEVGGPGGEVGVWIDWNADNDWDEAGEQVFAGPLGAGTQTLNINVPAGAAIGQTFLRARISTQAGLPPTGPAPDGEVEDHAVEVTLGTDFGDAPDPTYPTLLASNGARHSIDGRLYLGAGVDHEPDGQPDPNALGDDNDVLYPPANDDEDGVVFTSQLIAGQTATVDVTTSAPGLLNAWVDFNADGDWADWGEQIFVDLALAGGTTTLSFTVPNGATPWVKTFARFRFSSVAGLSYDGPAPDGEVEDYRVWVEEVETRVKWDQPPVSAEPENVFYGWNEPSVHEEWQIAADDWVCTTADPVTEITWWGSLLGWTDPYDPPLPDYFHLAIWTDVPAGVDEPFSHPGQVVWETDCTNYTWQFVGWDYDPRTGTYEACFRFDQVLPQAEWFYQDPAENSIYWLSVAAAYPVGGGTDHPFGWKTLPRDPASPAPDDAVMIWEPTGAHVGQVYVDGGPIYWPTDEDSWDLAFELRTGGQEVVKWAQMPDLEMGLDVLAGPRAFESSGPYEKFLADDFLCMEPGPITDITFWGSYLQDDDMGARPLFNLGIYADIPADQSPTGYSMPGDLLWSDYRMADRYMIVEEAQEQFYDPNRDAIIGADWLVWRFDFKIPEPEAFWQEPNNVYWLGVHHSFDLDADGIVNYRDLGWVATGFAYGWKTSLDHWNDDAVWTDVDSYGTSGNIVPPNGPWNELRYPANHRLAGQSIDLSFRLGTHGIIKWEQLPDVSPTGMDVLDGPIWAVETGVYEKFLADDFLCTQSGPITVIDIYSSYFEDMRIGELPLFNLAIYADIPADESPTGYSIPGELLWSAYLTPDVEEIYADAWEDFYDPNIDQIIGWDSMVWRYRFNLDPVETFHQTEGTIYWLGLNHSYDLNGDGIVDEFDENMLMEVPWAFGWKTSADRWNDDAVWTDVDSYGTSGQIVPPDDGPWSELIDPDTGESLHLAFELYTSIEPAVKWSQPPLPYVPEDAFHGWDEPSIYGGQQIVADDWFCDTDQPVTDAHWWGSYVGWPYPEPPEMPREFHIAIWTDVPAGVDAPWSHPGEVIWETYCDVFTWQFVGWDFDPRDPLAAPEATFLFEQDIHPDEWFWQDPGENIYWVSIAAVYPLGQPEFPWGWKTRPRDPLSPAPDDAVRIFFPTAPLVGMVYEIGEPIEWPEGQSWDMAFVLTTRDLFDWGDAPDPPYPTLLASGGARHRIVPGFYLGATVDAEPDGQPTALANGDGADEDGVVFTSVLVRNNLATVDVTASAPGMLDAWVDFAGDGSWTEAGDQIFAAQPLVMGVNSLTFPVPGTAQTGRTVSRWRFSTAGALPYDGPAPDGEVEDHPVKVVPGATISGTKWRDKDGDRVWDAGEPGRQGWTIFLDADGDGVLDAGETSTTTDVNGNYTFTDLLPGVHMVDEVQQYHWIQTFPAGGLPHNVVLAVGGTATGVDFGNAVAGDANGDAATDYLDLGILATYYDICGPGINWSLGDFNWDNCVNYLDLGILATHYDYNAGPPSAESESAVDLSPAAAVSAPAPAATAPAPAGAAAEMPWADLSAAAWRADVPPAGDAAAGRALLPVAPAARPWANLDEVVDLLAGPSLSVLPAALV